MKKVFIAVTSLLIANLSMAQTQAFKDDVKKVVYISRGSGTIADVGNKIIIPMIAVENREAFNKESEIITNEYTAELEKFYLERYTHEEIKQILTFYDSPVGRKIIAESKLLTEKNMELTMKYSDRLQKLRKKYIQ